MTNSIQKALCSISNFIAEFKEHFRHQYQGVDASVKPVSISDKVPVQMARRNPSVVEIWICNKSDKDLMLGPATANINRDLFSVIIAPKDTIIINAHNFSHLFKQGFDGFWEEGATDDSKAMVTEYYLSS